MARWFLFGCVLCALCSFGGCAVSKSKPVSVTGTVNLDKKPLDDGSVVLAGEGGAAPDTLPVKDGKFEGQATPGKKHVEIRAFKKGKPTKMGDVEIEAPLENYLPARFNTQSKLTAEVTANGINPNTFEVESK